FRFNADRDVASDVSFHAQLSTGAVNNGITFDQDFAGSVTRHPFFISEAWMDYHRIRTFHSAGAAWKKSTRTIRDSCGTTMSASTASTNAGRPAAWSYAGDNIF